METMLPKSNNTVGGMSRFNHAERAVFETEPLTSWETPSSQRASFIDSARDLLLQAVLNPHLD